MSRPFSRTIIGLLKDYRDKRFTKRWWKQIRKEGYFLAIIGLVILGLSIWQYIYTQKQNKLEKEQAAKEQRNADALLQKRIGEGVDSGLRRISNGMAKSFNGQDLKIDSLAGIVSAVRDSAGKRVITNNNYPEGIPTVAIPMNGMQLDMSNELARLSAECHLSTEPNSPLNHFSIAISVRKGFNGSEQERFFGAIYSVPGFRLSDISTRIEKADLRRIEVRSS